MNRVISIRKMGTRRGEPHYSVECRRCRSCYGRPAVLAVGYLSKDAADRMADQHVTQYGCA